MKSVVTIFLALASVHAWAAPELSVAMNGEYRCDNGRSFTATVLSAPVIASELRMTEGAAMGAGNQGTAHPVIDNKTVGFDLHGVKINVDGKSHKLFLQDGAALVLRGSDDPLQWEIASGQPPYSGRLRYGEQSLGENCTLVDKQAAP